MRDIGTGRTSQSRGYGRSRSSSETIACAEAADNITPQRGTRNGATGTKVSGNHSRADVRFGIL